ncbi:hypothetical protein Tco_1028167 [Tanacetum coccineum]
MAHSNAVMGSWGSAVKTSASYTWRNSRPNFNYNSGPTSIRTVNANGPQGRPKPAKAWGPSTSSLSGLELHLSLVESLMDDLREVEGCLRVRIGKGDKEVTRSNLVAKVVMEVLGCLLSDMIVRSWRF